MNRLDPLAALARYPALHQPLGTLTDLGGGGGLSGSRLWRFESGRGPLLLRAWPSPGPSRSRLLRIHQWLAEASDLGWIPLPLPALDGATPQALGGRFWELAPWREGAPDGVPPSRARVSEGFRALASIHRRWERECERGPSPGLRDRLDELEVLEARGMASLGRAVDLAEAEDNGTAVLARRWLSVAPAALSPSRAMLRAAMAVEITRQPCLRDVRRAHFLFLGDRLNALVDFGAMGEETVVGDVSRLSMDWLGDDPALRRLALDAYESIRPLRPAEHALMPVFEATAGLLSGAHWLRWHYLEGRTFDDPGAVRDGIARSLDELSRPSGSRGVDVEGGASLKWPR